MFHNQSVSRKNDMPRQHYALLSLFYGPVAKVVYFAVFSFVSFKPVLFGGVELIKSMFCNNRIVFVLLEWGMVLTNE